MRRGSLILALALTLGACGGPDLTNVQKNLRVRTSWRTADNKPLLDFGPIPVLDTRTAVVELTSIGRAPVQIKSIEVVDAPADVFEIVYTQASENDGPILEPVFSLPGGTGSKEHPYNDARIRIGVKFVPQALQNYSGGRLKIVHDGVDSPAYVSILAEGSTSGSIQVEPSPLDFGRVGEQQQSVLTTTLASVGTGPLVIHSVQLLPVEGDDAVPPEITFAGSTSTEGIVLPPPEGNQPGGSVQIPVRCAPTTDTVPVDLAATLRVESNDLDHRITDVPVTCKVNRAPIAEIDDTQVGAHGPGIAIDTDGSASHDPDGDDPITYLWSLQPPAGSNSELDDPTAAVPTFTPDVAGTYVLTLVVVDATGVPCVPKGGGAIAACDRIEYDVTSPDELTIELSWESALTDLDLHVVEDGFDFFTGKDCWWRNRRDDAPKDSAYPGQTKYCAEWNTSAAEDDPTMFPDALAKYGPERVLIGEGSYEPPAGVYDVGVVFSKTNGVPPEAAATRAILRVYVYGKLSAQRDLILQPDQLWKVFRITWQPTAGGATFEYLGDVTDLMP
jgi:hypothetical protein